MNTPLMLPITSLTEETSDIKTFHFPFKGTMQPGQFFMIWIPGVDEIPMSVSFIDPNTKAITFRKVGDATTVILNKKRNELIGVRGPYGNGFQLQATRPLYIGGGTGTAMLCPAIEQDLKNNREVTVIIGAQTKKDLLFQKRIEELSATVYLSTDDGSAGYHGYASSLALDLIASEDFDGIYTCGPEAMMKTIYDHRHDIPLQASLERYMKCGIGVCGHCCVGKGLRVCYEGPVFNDKTLESIQDFGVFTRDETGAKKPLNEG